MKKKKEEEEQLATSLSLNNSRSTNRWKISLRRRTRSANKRYEEKMLKKKPPETIVFCGRAQH